MRSLKDPSSSFKARPAEFVCAFHNFSVCREGIALFTPLNFTLKTGELCEITGRNGVGKTSFLEAVAGLSLPTTGDFTYTRRPFYFSTNSPFEPEESVEKNLRFWQRLYDIGDSRYERAVSTWSLVPILQIPYKHLSTGQKQRLGFARLHLNMKQFWLLDEPLLGLDAQGVETFKDLLKAFLNRGGAALMATHTPLGWGSALELKTPTFQEASKLEVEAA